MRSNLIPITRIYDIYPKYTYSDGVKKFMDEIVDIDRANAYSKDEVIAMLTEIQLEIREIEEDMCIRDSLAEMGFYRLIKDSDVENIIQEKINKLKREEE